VLNVLSGVFNFCDLQHLKRILNDTLDDDCHRIRPCQKGDTAVYLHFRQLGDMELARESLDNQSIADYKLTVTVS
jgi:hypothetical protein